MPTDPLTPSDVGRLVTVRAQTRVGAVTVVGTLESVSAGEIRLRRRDGELIAFASSSVTHARRVPPTPAERVPVAELELVMAEGWRAVEADRLGDWVLRAAGGFTSRANSALAVGRPSGGIADAVTSVESWYAARHLPPRIQLPAPDDEGRPVRDVLAARGWQPVVRVHVMTSSLGPVVRAAAADPGVDIRLDETPDAAWLAAYRRDAGPLPAVARQVLTAHPRAVFASVREEDACVAIARATVDARWAGLYAVEVAPTHRRRGLARAVSIEALRWAARQGGRHAYLQVAADNSAATALYGRMGFSVHHDYVHYVGSVDG